MEGEQSHQSFGALRGYFWPIRRHELGSVLPLMLIFFLVSLNYNLLRCLKDSLVIPSTQAGASVIPFLKFLIFPGAIFLTYLYTRIANHFSIEKVFYLMIGGFLSFFFFFSFVYLPSCEQLHLHPLADFLQAHLPKGYLGFSEMIRYWGFSLFYVMSELWGSIVLFLLVWGFINQVTHFEQAKRIYALFGLVMNLGSILAGEIAKEVSQFYKLSGPGGHNPWSSMVTLTGLVLFCGVLSLIVFYYLTHYLFKDVRYQRMRQASSKVKMSVKSSISYIFQSRYLFYLAIIVFAYNAIINLCEVTWKEQARFIYSNTDEYLAFMGEVTTKVGVVSTLMSFCILGNTFRFGGWTFTAMITPAIIFVTTLFFFGGLLFSDTAMLPSVLLLGTMQNVLSRSSKYTVYDATKEVAFTPLDEESKLKGKASLDGLGSRFGKSGGAGINLLLTGLTGSLSNCVVYIGGIILVLCLLWMYAVNKLGGKLQQHFDADTYCSSARKKRKKKQPLSVKA